MYLILLSFFFIGLLFMCFFLYKQRQDFERKLKDNINDQNSELFSKMEFFFNQMNSSRDQSYKQTIDAINPINRFLEYMRNKLEDMEKSRVLKEAAISTTLNQLSETQKLLHAGTESLKDATTKMLHAFKNPSVKGRWGEMQLKKIAEITGMLPFCEFELQKDLGDARPDMVVNLPNGGYLFIDAKAPIESYLNIQEDENAKNKKEHLRLFKNHIYTLSNKKYWKKDTSPELVVMFIPMENIWLAALEEDPTIIEYATEKNVIISTPMTLIGLLKTIFFGWEQVHIAKEAEELKKVLIEVSSYMKKIKTSLNSSVEYMNKTAHECFTLIGKADHEVKKVCTIQEETKDTTATNSGESEIIDPPEARQNSQNNIQ